MAYYPYPDRQHPQYSGQHDRLLPSIGTILSKHNHTPFLGLPAMDLLQRSMLHWSGIDQSLPGEGRALQEWDTFHEDLVEKWRKLKNIRDAESIETPILPSNTSFFLIQIYLMFNRLLFNNELPPPKSNSADEDRPGIKLEWAGDLGEKNSGATNCDSSGGPIRIRILRRPANQEYLAGADAMAAVSSLLHEMCHVYDLANICWCHSCAPGGRPCIRRGRTGHGNGFLFIAWLVEKAANQVLGVFRHFDLGQRGSWVVEQKARRSLWRRGLDQGLPYEPIIKPGGKVIIPQQKGEVRSLQQLSLTPGQVS